MLSNSRYLKSKHVHKYNILRNIIPLLHEQYFCNVSNNVKIDYFDGTECVTLAHTINVIIFNFQLFGGEK